MQRISELFTLSYGHSLELNRLEQAIGPESVHFVSRAARNNGVTARVRPISDLEPAPAGTITVALNGQGGAGVAFLQPYPYYTSFHIMILTPRKPMTEQEKLWWVLCITTNRFRFGFGRQANRTLKDLCLPAVAEVPAWVAGTSTDRYSGAESPRVSGGSPTLNSSSWRPYVLGQLFHIRKGRRLTKANMRHGDVPFVGASDSENGVTARVGQRPIHQGGTISVSYNGSVAEAFYQPVPFWASDDVNVLYPRGFDLTPNTALFLCTVIRQEKYRFNYGRKWHLDRMREAIIKLPATPLGEPDWASMDAYVSTLPYSSSVA